jgi:hypothetical protein
MFGLVCLVVANVSHTILTRTAVIGEDSSDFVFGCFMGLAFGALFLSVWLRRKKSA